MRRDSHRHRRIRPERHRSVQVASAWAYPRGANTWPICAAVQSAGYPIAMLLKDKVALVTGAATGIGEAVARLFAEQGAGVQLFDKDVESCAKVAHSIGAAHAVGDVRNARDVSHAVESSIASFGHIDVLINNAGIFP